MDQDSVELSQERAVSSEPCSTRPHPIDESEHSARKRQKTSRSGSRSKSVDTTGASDIPHDSMSPSQHNTTDQSDSIPPSTPTRPTTGNSQIEPTSSRVTINLRTPHPPLDSIPSSPPSPNTPSKMIHSVEDDGVGTGGENESDALSTLPAIETPSSSPASLRGSPEIELIPDPSSNAEFLTRSPPIAIIDEDSDDGPDNPMQTFPYYSRGESLSRTVGKIVQFIQFESIENDEAFVLLRNWIVAVLRYTDRDEDLREMFLAHREFWCAFPNMVWALSWRNRWFGSFINRRNKGSLSLIDFLYHFAKLAGRFLMVDVKALVQFPEIDGDGVPELASTFFLPAYGHLLRHHDDHQHIGKNLENHYDWKWEADVHMLPLCFEQGGGSIIALTRLVVEQLKFIPQNPRIIENLSEPSKLVARMQKEAAIRLRPESSHQEHTDVSQKISYGYEYFTIMAPALDTIIEKHITYLTPDAATAHFGSLSYILSHTISICPQLPLVKERVEREKINHPHIPPAFICKTISMGWKFSILQKLITSAQMQLRVTGVTTMCQDLLALHTAHRPKDNLPISPVLLYFANFILQNKLVDYIVGIGSHPELINESHNIVGFLIVTKTYTPAQTDIIWQTVMASQDPRVVEAIIGMVRRCLNFYDYEPLLYLCRKVAVLPIEAFTGVMRGFVESLFKELVNKAANAEMVLVPSQVDTPPYDLCVRLIRESSIVSAERPDGYPDIQNFAAHRLRELLVHGPSLQARNDIYLSCIEDMSARTPTAPGSICVIHTLIRTNLVTDIHILTTNHGLTRLIIDELESTLSGNRSLAFNTPASHARRELLLLIITHEADTITNELGTRLWNLLVGAQSKDAASRQAGWLILNTAVAKATLSNRYLAICFQKHLPLLPPDCFTTGALEFVGHGLTLWLQEIALNFIENDGVFECLALEQIWRMILTAPPGNIDAAAINVIVDVYTESHLILSLPRLRARKIHLKLIDRCLKQLATAAKSLKSSSDDATSSEEEEMVIVLSESQMHDHELVFTRSLAVLREFLKAYQRKPQFATPKLRSTMTVPPDSVQGEPITVMYQSFDGGKQTEVKSLTIGTQNTAASLFASLQKATGFDYYKVFYGGREFNPDETEICKSLEDLNLKGLVLVQRREEADGLPGTLSGNNGSLEMEITKHFDEIWSYLGMQDKPASEIYVFLVQFPVYEKILHDISDNTVSHTQIFPLGQPYKALYALYALREYISTHSIKGSVDEAVFDRAMSLLVAAISDSAILDRCATEEIRHCLAMNLVNNFASLLKEPSLPESARSLLDAKLLDRLLQLLYTAKSVSTTTNSVHLTWTSFEAVLEAAIQTPALWSAFLAHLKKTTLLQELVLDDARSVIRKSVAKHISGKCTFGPNTTQVSSREITTTLWPIVANLIPIASENREQSEEVFVLALALLKRLSEDTTLDIGLDSTIQQWGALLLAHQTVEEVGRPESIDMVAHGLVTLLNYAVTATKSTEQTLSCSDLGPKLFQQHLFPELSEEPLRDDKVVTPRIPLLNTTTRHTMCETILGLVEDDGVQHQEVLKLLQSIVPYDATYEEHPYSFELGQAFDRSKAIRSSTGYVGLRNLSNTCYLNSLVTQLFMNTTFREFIFQAHVADNGSQKLLSETQILFANMQNSLKRYVDPTNFASTIRTFDDAQIDVTIQMDVDEFYNLLFDRWERQILAPDDKRTFRSFYGGQLVQQVKSKECPHISERMEEFSAIQCDIKGKSSLQESLQAYVDGEVMEGDNKYKCSTCDRHVDAVKRACLKDVPDNLIFHLKRFDFNLRTLQRSKINDHFEFPQKLDMRPYKVEHLMDEGGDAGEDIFELVGVLVHSGTAESGHYYSFIRERPSASNTETWVEFNDDCVTSWDPSSMEANCFGGLDVRGSIENGSMQYEKNYSAYMLFYQRSSKLVAAQQAQQALQKTTTTLGGPIKLPILPKMSAHLAMENEVLMRKYCLYDPSHPSFVMKMMQNVNRVNGGTCSDTHELEKQVMHVAVSHLDQVVSRTKDVPDFSNFAMALRQQCQLCGECSRDFLEYLCDCSDALRFLLMKCPEIHVRTEIANSILAALIKLKTDLPYAYGLERPEDGDEGKDPKVLLRVVSALSQQYETFHTCLKAWPEYFGLLSSIANLGDHEAAVLLDDGFLHKSLDIITADPLLNIGTQLQRMLTNVSKRSSTKPASYDCVVGLMAKLLQACIISSSDLGENESRLALSLDGLEVPLTPAERDKLFQRWTRNNSNILTEKLLQINQNQYATRMIIITLLHIQDEIDNNIYHAILNGLRKSSISGPGPFLRAALIYCEHSEAEHSIQNMVHNVAKYAAQVDSPEGRDYLQFFKDIINLPTNANDISQEEIYRYCLSVISNWAPALLTYYDAAVRADTEDFLNEIIFCQDIDVDADPDIDSREGLIVAVAQQLARSCLNYLRDVYIRQRQQAVRSVLMNIQHTIELCVRFFGDEDSPSKSQLRNEMEAVLPALRKCLVEEADEDVSEWEGSDGDYGSSEPMDSITELCGPLDNDLEATL